MWMTGSGVLGDQIIYLLQKETLTFRRPTGKTCSSINLFFYVFVNLIEDMIETNSHLVNFATLEYAFKAELSWCDCFPLICFFHHFTNAISAKSKSSIHSNGSLLVFFIAGWSVGQRSGEECLGELCELVGDSGGQQLINSWSDSVEEAINNS